MPAATPKKHNAIKAFSVVQRSAVVQLSVERHSIRRRPSPSTVYEPVMVTIHFIGGSQASGDTDGLAGSVFSTPVTQAKQIVRDLPVVAYRGVVAWPSLSLPDT